MTQQEQKRVLVNIKQRFYPVLSEDNTFYLTQVEEGYMYYIIKQSAILEDNTKGDNHE